jgi:uncharacterized protein (DUF305 family)
MKATILSVAFAMFLVPMAGCSNDSSVAGGDFNEDDVMFAQMMIPHHEQAIEMSDIALDPTVGASDAVRMLAMEIKAAQDPEINQMIALLEAWGRPLTPMDGMDHGSMMQGMLSPDELLNLGNLSGSAFDEAWVLAMINHHEGAILMADEVLNAGKNPEIRALAEQIIATQQAEIETLRALLP